MNENGKKVYDFIKGNLINAIVIITGLSYIIYGMLTIERTQLTVAEVIAKAGIGVIVGFMMKAGIGENGFNKGYNSLIWIDEFTTYNKTCNLANDYIERVDNFYACEVIEKKKSYRRTLLMGARMRYDWFFDEKGNYIENEEKHSKLDKHQLRILKKCVNVKIYTLNLFSEYANEIANDTKKEKTDKMQRTYLLGRNGSVQILTAIAGAYFTAMWNGWNLGDFIWHTVQVCIWIFCGILQLYQNYNYVVVEKINKLKRKKELIVKFVKGCEEGKYLVNPYDEIEREEQQ